MSGVLHVASLVSYSLQVEAMYAGLHLLVMVLGIYSFLVYKANGRKLELGMLSQPARWLSACVFLYFLGTMAYLVSVTLGGNAALLADGPALMDHGKFVHALSWEEYNWMKALELRFISCGWVLGFLSVGVYLETLRVELARRNGG